MSRTALVGALRRALRAAWMAERKQTRDSRAIAEEMRAHPSRRQFLRQSAGAIGLAAIGGAAFGSAACGGGEGSGGPRVAVVGAGLAGLHCAYRLQQSGISVQVFEGSNRIGGRAFTARGLLAGGQIAELGGEFVDSQHAWMHQLVSELGLTLDDLTEESGIRAETFYFQGRLIGEDELVEQFRPLAASMAEAVAAAEENEEVFARLDAVSIAEWLEGATEVNLLVREIIEVAYVGEFGLEADQQSVFNLLNMIDFEEPDPVRLYGDSDERYHVHEGSDAIASGLAAPLASRISLGERLVRVRNRGAELGLTFERDGRAREHSFDQVVLAIPFSTLRLVELMVDLPPRKRQVIDELGYGTNAKLMMQFSRRVWRADHAASGSAFSDNGLQASWETSRGQDGEAGILSAFVGGEGGALLGAGTAEERAAEALPRIDEIFPGTGPTYLAGSALRMRWPSAPFSLGSYSCYRPGQSAFAGSEGERVGNLHFCGEHTSVDYQGFMEGACETGAVVAASIAEEAGVPLQLARKIAT